METLVNQIRQVLKSGAKKNKEIAKLLNRPNQLIGSILSDPAYKDRLWRKVGWGIWENIN